MQGQRPCPRSAERGTLLCFIKRRRGSKGEPSPGVPPFSLRLYVCADTLGGGRWPVLRFDPISLVLAQRNGVEPPKKSAFLPWRLHHSRERCKSVDGAFLARLGAGDGSTRTLVGHSIMPCEIFSSSTRWTLSSMRLSVRRPSVTAASRTVRAVSMSGMPRRMSPPASRNFMQTSPLS